MWLLTYYVSTGTDCSNNSSLVLTGEFYKKDFSLLAA